MVAFGVRVNTKEFVDLKYEAPCWRYYITAECEWLLLAAR